MEQFRGYLVSGNSELSQRNKVTVSAEGHSSNGIGQCKVRNAVLVLPSSVELRSVIKSGLEYVMGGCIGKQYGEECCGLG